MTFKAFFKKNLLIILSIGGIIFLKTPLFEKTSKQYQLVEEDVYEEVLVEPADSDKQSTAKKIEEVLGKNEESTPASDRFNRWSILDNYADGYRLLYPAGFKVDHSLPGKVEITPPSGGGMILVYLKDNGFSVTSVTDGLSTEQTDLINEAARLIEQSFEFIEGSGYSSELRN
jgi:hypothetical protein